MAFSHGSSLISYINCFIAVHGRTQLASFCLIRIKSIASGIHIDYMNVNQNMILVFFKGDLYYCFESYCAHICSDSRIFCEECDRQTISCNILDKLFGININFIKLGLMPLGSIVLKMQLSICYCGIVCISMGRITRRIAGAKSLML